MCQAIAGAHYWQRVVNQLHLPIINLGWNIQFMQIVSEALFQRIKEQALFYTSTHNRIAYVTQSELILREITLQARSESIKIKGKQVIALSLQNANFIVILFASGFLQVRKVDSLKQVLLHTSLALHKDTNIKMRVSSESIYVLNRHYIDVVGLSKQKTFRKIYLQNKKQQPQDIVISTIFEEEIIILQFKESIAITTEGKAIAQAPFTNINTFKVLKDPLFIGQSKEFLLVVESKRYLKIFDIFDLQQILQMQLFFEENQQLQLKVDPLSQFVMLKIFQTNGVTKRNSLLKINTDFYRGEATEPFFLFDIQIGLKHDFILFPSHNELIKGAKFHSVDMCFFTKKEIRIASLVIDVNHRTKLNNVKCVSTNWKSESGWKDFFFNVKTDELQKQQKKFDQIQFHQESQEEHWEKFISKFYQQNMQKFKCQNFYKINQAAQPKKYLQYSTRYNKDLIENEDALNTLSGSSSFGSLKEGTPQIPFLKLRLSEGQNLSEEESIKGKLSFIAQSSGQSEESERDFYFKHIQTQVLKKFDPFQSDIDSLNNKIQRISQVHARKLKNININLKKNVKQVQNIQKNVQKWCKEEIQLFGGQIKQELKEFSSILGRLQIMEIRSVKKLKKHYRDYLEIQIEQCAQKLEQSQKTLAGIENILKKQRIE